MMPRSVYMHTLHSCQGGNNGTFMYVAIALTQVSV
jgi:hypothetical protein